MISIFIYRANDIKLSNVLDFEIWRASDMLFQKFPYENRDENHEKYKNFLFRTNETNWDDTWHETLEKDDRLTIP